MYGILLLLNGMSIVEVLVKSDKSYIYVYSEAV